MGSGIRFSDKTGYVSTKLTNRIWNHYNTTPLPGAGAKTFNVEEQDRNKFINDSDDWMDGCWNNNETDDEYVYRVYALDNIEDHHRTVYQKQREKLEAGELEVWVRIMRSLKQSIMKLNQKPFNVLLIH